MEKRKVVEILIAVLLIGCFLRFYNLGEQPLWMDEGYTLETIQWEVNGTNSFDIAMDRVASRESTPPLYYAMLYKWTRLTGFSEFYLRFPSAIFSLISVLFIFLIGRKLFNDQIGLFAAVLMATSMVQIIYAQEARAYTLFVMLGLLSCYFFIRMILDAKGAIPYMIVTILMLTSHYFAFLILLAQASIAFAFFFKSDIRKLIDIATCIVISSLLAVLASSNFIFSQIQSNHQFLQMALCYRLHLCSIAPLGLMLFLILALLASIIFIILQRRYNLLDKLTLTPISWIIFFNLYVVIALIIGTVLNYSFVLTRYTLFLLPILYILMAIGLYRTKNYKVLLALLLILNISLLSFGYYTDDTRKEEWDNIAWHIASNESSRDIILIIDQDLDTSFKYYYKGNLPTVKLKSLDNIESNNKMWNTTFELTRSWDNLWYISTHNYRANSFWKEKLDSVYTILDNKTFNGAEVYYYDIRR